MHKAEKSEIFSGLAKQLSEGWTLEREDGTIEEVQYPVSVPTQEGEICTFINTLPSIKHNNRLMFYSDQKTSVLVDGELRYRYNTIANPYPGEVVKNIIHMVYLYPEDSGKEIRIIKGQKDMKSGKLKLVAIGDTYGLFMFMLSTYGLSFTLSLIILLIVFVLIVLNVYLNLKFHDNTNLYPLILGILLIALWCISNSMLFQNVFNVIYIDGFMRFEIAMVLPIPFLIHLNRIQKYRHERNYTCVEIILLINLFVFNWLQNNTNHSFVDTMGIFCIPIGVALVYGIITVLVDLIRGDAEEYKTLAVGYLGMCGFAMIELFLNASGILGSTTYNGFFIMVGIYFLLLMALFLIVSNIREERKIARLAIMASEQKTSFLAKMSHEIRTPITAILGMNEMILRESKEPEIKEYAIDIKGAGNSLLAIINDVLDLTKIESGKMEIVEAEYEVSNLIFETVNMVQIKAKSKNLDLIIDVDKELPSVLIGDNIRIRQCLINILNNAVKYTEKGSVTFRVNGERIDNKVKLSFFVTDTGIGIKEEDIPKLYDRFTRIDEKRNRSVEGTGLGMSITSQLLNLMGSKIEVESEYGKGSCFHFDLVQEIHDDTPVGNLSEKIRNQIGNYSFSAKFTAPWATILIIDDNGINRMVVRNLLKNTKMKIDEGDSGDACLKLCDEKKYDIIFLDHMMPGMDGIETLEKLKEKKDGININTPVIMLTANAVNGAKEMYIEAGFDAVLSKPIVYEKLEETLIEYLTRSENAAKSVGTVQDSEAVGDSDTDLAGDDRSNTDLAGDDIREKADTEREFAEILEGISEIDVAYALMYNPNITMLCEVIADNFDIIDDEADKVKRYYDELLDKEALNNYRTTVHAIKSSMAMIGAMSLSGLAKMLEMAAIEEKLDTIKGITPEFIKEMKAFKEAISPLVAAIRGTNEEGEDSIDGKPIADMDVIRDQLLMMKSALEDFDMDMADNILNFLSEFSYPEEIREDMEKLIIAVRNVDDDKAIEIIDRIV